MNSHSQVYLPRLSHINKIIIIISSVIFVINFALTQFGTSSLVSLLSLNASDFFSGHIYKILTYIFASRSLLELILNSLMLWLMASEFEVNWGRKKYLTFLAVCSVGGGLVYLLVNLLFFSSSDIYSFGLTGLSGIVSSMCLAYAIVFPDRIFSFLMIIPIKAKYFCMLLVIISLFQGLSGPSGVGAWGQLGAIFAAFLFMITLSNKKFKQLAQKVSGAQLKKNSLKKRSHLKLVKDDEDNDPKYWQ